MVNQPSDNWDDVFDYDQILRDLGKSPIPQAPPPEEVQESSDAIPNPFNHAAKSFEPKIDYLKDPVKWGRDVLGEHYHIAQAAVMESVRDHRYTAVQSCHDAGKSFIAARLAVLWIAEHEPGEAFVISTAPTSAQVSAILWREIQRAFGKGAFKGNITTAGYPQWKIGGEIVGYGRKPADYSQSAFQGIHARYILIIIDEACGVDESLFNSVDALATNVHARVLAIGNPDDPTSHFAAVCKPNSGWHVIRIDGLLTPNFTRDLVEDLECYQCANIGRETPLLAQLMEEEGLEFTQEEVPDDIRDLLLSPLWVEERIHRWVGLPNETQTLAELANQSALWLSKVRGLFPTSNTEGVIPLGWVELAMARWREWDTSGRPSLPVNERHVLGVDVATTGTDECCISFREGPITHELRPFRTAEIMELVGHVKAAMSSRKGSLAIIDGIGLGAGAVSRLREQHMPVKSFIASASARGFTDKTGELQFVNLRAAAWWHLRELLDPTQPGGSKLILPDREILKSDLTSVRWKMTSGGKIQIESKDDIRKRLGRSPDEGDSVVMSYWSGKGTIDTDEKGVLSWWSDTSDDSVNQWVTDEEAANAWSQV